MYCKNCGTLLSGPVDFCPQCGADLRKAPAQQACAKTSSQTFVIAAALVVALVAAAIAICAYMANDQALHQKYDLSISLVCDSDDGLASSPLPVLIEGTDFEGNAVSQRCLLSMDRSDSGDMPELVRGTYRVSIAGSPILSDGSLCAYDDSAVTVEVTADGDESVALPAMTVIVPANTTNEQVLLAYGTLVEYGMDADEADTYKDAAEKRISDYQDQVAAEKAQKEAEEAAAKAAQEAAAAKAAQEAAAAKATQESATASAITYETDDYCVKHQARWTEYVWNGEVVGQSGTRLSIDLDNLTLIVEYASSSSSGVRYYRISENCKVKIDGNDHTLEQAKKALESCYAQKSTEMGPITNESAPAHTTAYVYGTIGTVTVETQNGGQVVSISFVS